MLKSTANYHCKKRLAILYKKIEEYMIVCYENMRIFEFVFYSEIVSDLLALIMLVLRGKK